MTTPIDSGAAGPDEGPDGDYILAVEGLVKSFGEQVLYRGLDLSIRPGEIVVIIGQSGVGKSVFIKHLIGLEDPTQGRIWYRMRDEGEAGIHLQDLPIHRMTEDQMGMIRREVSIVFQESSLFDWMTVFDNISLPLVEHRDLLLRRMERMAGHPRELVRLLMRSARPAPGPIEELLVALEPHRARLVASAARLREGLDEEAVFGVVLALAVDLAHDLGLSRPDLRVWEERRMRALLSLLVPETIGRFLALVGEGELSGPLSRYRSAWVAADGDLRGAWAMQRDRLASQRFELLAHTLTCWVGKNLGKGTSLEDGVREWLRRSGWDARGLSAASLVREALGMLKTRPALAAALVLAAHPDSAPPAWDEFVMAARRFQERMDALRDVVASAPDEARAMALAWLARHPLVVDRRAQGFELVRSVVEALAMRPEDLGEILGRLSPTLLPEPLAGFVATYGAYRQSLIEGFLRVLALPAAVRVEALTQLIVSGLMTVLKLEPGRDGAKLPSQLSGGMKTRVGIARSLAILPRVVLYDEPTAGLDPVLSKAIAREILAVQASGVVTTSVVVTHDKELYRTLRESGRTRMLYLYQGLFLDAHGVPVEDRLRAGAPWSPPSAVVSEGLPFIEEFEPAAGGAAGGSWASGPAPAGQAEPVGSSVGPLAAGR